METHAFRLQTPGNAPEGQKQFPISNIDDLALRRSGNDQRSICRAIYLERSSGMAENRDLTQNFPGVVSLAGHFSTADQRHLLVAGRVHGTVHEFWWKPAQPGIEGHDDLPVTFGAGSIVSVATMTTAISNVTWSWSGRRTGRCTNLVESGTTGDRRPRRPACRVQSQQHCRGLGPLQPTPPAICRVCREERRKSTRRSGGRKTRSEWKGTTTCR